MAKWYIVKKNWDTISKEYLGLGGDIWPEINIPLEGKILLEKLFTNKEYTELSGITLLVVTEQSMAEEYFLYQKQLESNPILIAVTDDTDMKDVDGYDFGNPEGGYSVIESVILVQNDEILKKNI